MRKISVYLFIICITVSIFYRVIALNRGFRFDSDFYILAGCSVLNANGIPIKKFPYEVCLPMDDGGLIVRSRENDSDSFGIKRIDQSGKVVWEILLPFHHLINFSEDKKFIFAIGSEEIMLDDGIWRADIFYKIDVDGKIISEWHMKDNLSVGVIKEFKSLKQVLYKNIKHKKNSSQTKYEIAHSNSIFEILPNDFELKDKRFKRGNIIVSLLGRIIVLDDQLKSILWVSRRAIQAHSVSFQKNGILLFNSESNYRSSVELWDPISESTIFELGFFDQVFFHSTVLGGVRPMANRKYLIWYNHFENWGSISPTPETGIMVVNEKGEAVWRQSYKTEIINNQKREPDQITQAQYINLREFFKNSRL